MLPQASHWRRTPSSAAAEGRKGAGNLAESRRVRGGALAERTCHEWPEYRNLRRLSSECGLRVRPWQRIVSPGLSSVPADSEPIMTAPAPAAIAFETFAENQMPPSDTTGTSRSVAARAQSVIAVTCGTPALGSPRGRGRGCRRPARGRRRGPDGTGRGEHLVTARPAGRGPGSGRRSPRAAG